MSRLGSRDELLKELKRKSIHMIPGFLAIPVIMWAGRFIALVIAVFFFILYTLNEISLRRDLGIKVPIAYHTYKFMARKDEVEKKYFTGTVYFWGLTVAIIAVLPQAEAAAAIMISSLGDAAAAIAGKAIDRPKLPYNKNKTLAGTISMFIVGYLSCLATGGIKPIVAIIASLSASIIESVTSRSVIDEVTVPLTALAVFLVL